MVHLAQFLTKIMSCCIALRQIKESVAHPCIVMYVKGSFACQVDIFSENVSIFPFLVQKCMQTS